MSKRQPLDDLLREAESQPVIGWDFSWLGDRISSNPLPWDYEQILLRHTQCSADLLDMGQTKIFDKYLQNSSFYRFLVRSVSSKDS